MSAKLSTSQLLCIS